MKKLMEEIHERLASVSDVRYEDLERNKDGEVDFDGIKVVYDLPAISHSLENHVRVNIPLIIDLWFKAEHYFEAYELIEEIDLLFNDVMIDVNCGTAKVDRDIAWVTKISDPDPDIRRMQIRYIINYYR